MALMDSPTIALRRDVQNLLKMVHSRVLYVKASKNTQYPYIVYKISDMGDSKKLELDYWDRNSDSAEIETMADDVKEILDQCVLTNEQHCLIFYHGQDRQPLTDDDPQILRINESYEIRYFGKD